MVNAPKTLTTSLGCLGALLTVVMAFRAFREFNTFTEQGQLPGERVEAAVFAPDGKTLYALGTITTPNDKLDVLQAWDAMTGKRLWRKDTTRSTLGPRLAISHNGKKLLTVLGLSPCYYDSSTGQRTTSLTQSPPLSTYCPVVFTQNDKEIIAVLADGSGPVVLDATTGKLKRKLQTTPKLSTVNLALSQDGKQVVFQQGNQLVLRDLATNKTLAKQTIKETYHVTPFHFIPDTYALANKQLQFGERVWTPGKPGWATSFIKSEHAAYSPDGSRFVILENRGSNTQRFPLGTITNRQGGTVTLEGKTGW